MIVLPGDYKNGVEELLETWTLNCMKKYNTYNVIYSGGVAMNIKAMGKLAEIKKLKKLLLAVLLVMSS